MRRAKPPRVTPGVAYSGCEWFLAELGAIQRQQKSPRPRAVSWGTPLGLDRPARAFLIFLGPRPSHKNGRLQAAVKG